MSIVGPAEPPGYDERGVDFDSLPQEIQEVLEDDSDRYLPGPNSPREEMIQRMGSCEF